MIATIATAAAATMTAIRQHFALIIFFQMLSYFCVAMLIVGNDNFTGVRGGDPRFAIEFP